MRSSIDVSPIERQRATLVSRTRAHEQIKMRRGTMESCTSAAVHKCVNRVQSRYVALHYSLNTEDATDFMILKNGQNLETMKQ